MIGSDLMSCYDGRRAPVSTNKASQTEVLPVQTENNDSKP